MGFSFCGNYFLVENECTNLSIRVFEEGEKKTNHYVRATTKRSSKLPTLILFRDKPSIRKNTLCSYSKKSPKSGGVIDRCERENSNPV